MGQDTLHGAVTGRAADLWRDATPAQRRLFTIGAFLVVAGLAHLVPALVGDRPWQGPISFRKPALFGVSFGLTCAAIAWMLTYLRIGRRAHTLVAVMLGGGSLVEVAAVSLQAWRGVPSHFNVTTGAFNAAVFNVMGLTVVIIAASIALVTLWSLVRMDAPAPLALGIRAGLLLLLVSQGLGAHMVSHGLAQVAAQTGQEPNIFGAAGQLKLPHAVTIHAAQVLPGIAWLLGFSAWSQRRRLTVTATAVAGYTALTAAAALQTFAGRAPADLLPASGALLMLAVTLLAGAVAATAVALGAAGASARPSAET